MKLKSPIVFVSGAIVPYDYPDGGYFKNIKDYIEQNEYHIVPVDHWGSVEKNKNIIEEYIGSQLKGKSFHLVAHSKGGIDSLYWYQKTKLKSLVLSFTSMASPFKGTTLAYLLPVGDLKPKNIGKYTQGPMPPNSHYITSCINSLGQVSPLLYPTWLLLRLLEGPNDGVVSQNSCEYGEYIKTFFCDHPALIGHFNDKKRQNQFEVCLKSVLGHLQKIESNLK